MNHSIRCASLCSLLLASTAFAEDNTSTIISGTYSNVPGGVIVGNTGSNNTLTVNGGGTLNTTNWSVIGFNAGADHNTATVTDTGSVWSSKGGFYVGGFSSFNRLIVTAGGAAIASNDSYLAMDPASSNNSVVITGPGSQLVLPVNDEFGIGYAGCDNEVVVSNAGSLAARQVTVGMVDTAARNRLLVYSGIVTANYVYVGDDGGKDNRILLTGANSFLYASNTFACGVSGRASRVEILNGARAESGWGRIGWEVAADSNGVVVSGAGSSWSNRNDLDVGLRGSFNTLVITNGGTVWSGGWTPIGQESNSVGNLAVVTGPGSLWRVTNIFLVGERGLSNRLEIRDGGCVSNDWFAYIGGSGAVSSNAHGNSVLVSGTNTRWVSRSTVWVGEKSGWNRLDVRDGAFFAASNFYFGSGFCEWTGNVIDVSGPGTIWTNTGDADISGSANSCAVSNGATVYCQNLLVDADHSNEPTRITIDGSNTQWFCARRAVVGLSWSYGQLVVTNGARLSSAGGMIGQEGTDEGNSALVTGPGSVWTNTGVMSVGHAGQRSLLTIERGGRVYSTDGRVGAYTGGNRNTARVNGTGSMWQCAGSLLVGDSHFNSLFVENGATFACTSAVVGYGMSNVVLVTGAGSSWSNSGRLIVSDGWFGEFDGFTVSNGAFAYSQSAVLGVERGSFNYAVVSGAGSVWSNASSLWIGQTGQCNRLTVDGGGRLGSGSAVLGVSTASVGNVVTISGVGSSWTNGASLTVGLSAASNALVVAGGARVDAASVAVGVSNTARDCSIELQTGTVRAVSSFLLGTNAVLSGVGTVTVTSASFNDCGTVRPGLPFGRLHINAAFFQQSSGRIDIDLGGRDAGVTYDQLVSSGNLTMNGGLNVSRQPGFVPSSGDVFTVASAAVLTGTFATTNLPPWFAWSIQYAAGSILLSVTAVDTATHGVPKAWLADLGWTNDFDAAATNDADGDRVATWEEYYAGTDPTNGASFFQCLEMAKTNFPTFGNIVRWNAVTGRVYAIDSATNLFPAAWTERTNGLPAPANSWTDSAPAAANCQYRVRVGTP